MNYNAVMN
ncbi:hypothetical protein YPPY34_2708, partial [Yersinia pestis PY-34]